MYINQIYQKYTFSSDMRHSSCIIWAIAANLHTLDFTPVCSIATGLSLFLSILYQGHTTLYIHLVALCYGQNRKSASLMPGSEVKHMKLRATSLLMAGYEHSHVYGKLLGHSSLFFQGRMRVQSFSRCVSANDLLDLIHKHKSKWNVTVFLLKHIIEDE